MEKNNKNLVCLLLLTGLLMVMLPYVTGCSNSTSDDQSYVAVGAAGYDATEGTTVAVVLYQGDTPIADATMSVNDTVLPYGFPVTYQDTTNTIPFYYGSVAGTPGTTLNLKRLHSAAH